MTATLSEEQVETLEYAFDDSAKQSSWSNLPACETAARAGIRTSDLDESQLAAYMAVAEAALSDGGYLEYQQILAADDVLDTGMWSSGCYYMAFYGTPSTADAWTLQFGGHHYARTFTYDNGAVSTTPAFTGIEPVTFDDDGVTVDPLGGKRDAMFAMLGALAEDQLATAKLDGVFDDVVMGPGEDSPFPETEGLSVSQLDDSQKALVLAAITEWANDTADPIAADELARYEAELDTTTIAWASSIDDETQGAYGRIDGPSVWIEFENQGGIGSSGIHHHSILRDKTSDYAPV